MRATSIRQCTVHLQPEHSQLAGTRTLLHLLLLILGVTTATAADTSDAATAAKPCTAYAFWTDKGCRTWSTPCTF